MSRRLAIVVCASLAALIVISVPASAMAAEYWLVRDKAGRKQGVVNRGTSELGIPRGVVWTMATHGAFRGTVFRETQDGFVGWVVAGMSEATWIALIEKVNNTRYKIMGNRGYVQRATAGYWIVMKRVNGRYKRMGTVQKGCPGYYALGAARLLIWR